MTEKKYPWVVVVVGDGYAVARNGKDGTLDVTNYYAEWLDAQDEADWRNNEAEGITDAPRFDDDD